MREKGVGIGGVVSAIGWEAEQKGGRVEEEKVIKHIQFRFDVSREVAEYAIQIAEKYDAIGRENGKLYVKPRKIRTITT